MFDLSVVSLNSSFPCKTGPWGVPDQRRPSSDPRLEGEPSHSGVFSPSSRWTTKNQERPVCPSLNDGVDMHYCNPRFNPQCNPRVVLASLRGCRWFCLVCDLHRRQGGRTLKRFRRRGRQRRSCGRLGGGRLGLGTLGTIFAAFDVFLQLLN